MFDSAPENLYSHDPTFSRTHSPLEHPAEGMEELGLAGPNEGLDRATSEAFDPDSPTRWQAVEDPYDDDEDEENDGALPRGPLTCADLDKRGLWDVHDCCQDGCHDGSVKSPVPNDMIVPHPKGGNVLVRGCCALHEYLHNHLVKGHEDFLADLFGGDD